MDAREPAGDEGFAAFGGLRFQAATRVSGLGRTAIAPLSSGLAYDVGACL